MVLSRRVTDAIYLLTNHSAPEGVWRWGLGIACRQRDQWPTPGAWQLGQSWGKAE